MERLTTNKSVADMSMIDLAHNSCYADDERNARYRDYEMEMDARDFARNLMVTLAKDELPVDDAEFDEEILDNLTIDPFSDVRGLIALFYRNLWAMADLREKLKYHEDAEEQGLLLRLPISEDAPVYSIEYCCGKNKSNRSGMCVRGFARIVVIRRTTYVKAQLNIAAFAKLINRYSLLMRKPKPS